MNLTPELVEGVDLALQLDAVDQVNGYRDALLAQRIQEGILQGLALGHDRFSVFLMFRSWPRDLP